MAGEPIPGDLDAAWLRERWPDADEYEVEVFIELVGGQVSDGKSDDEARDLAFDCMRPNCE